MNTAMILVRMMLDDTRDNFRYETRFRRIRTVLIIICVMVMLQLSRIGIESIIFLFYQRTLLVDHAATGAAMTILVLIILLVAKVTGSGLSIFPKKFGIGYIIETVIFLGMFISSELLFCERPADIFMMVYGSLITPLFEELVFRGYAWNRLEKVFKSRTAVYLISVVLFAR